jgi:hypothetical protein
MGVLTQTLDQGAASAAPTAQPNRDSTGFFQNVGAGFTSAVAGTHSTRNADAIYQFRYYDQIIKALQSEGEKGTEYVKVPVLSTSPFYHPQPGDRVNANGVVYTPVTRDFRNPFVPGNTLLGDRNILAPLYFGGDQTEIGDIWSAVNRVRARKPDFLKGLTDASAVANLAIQERQRQLAGAQDITSRANTAGVVGQFIGGAVGSVLSLDPENAAVGGVGGAAGKTVARTVIKRGIEGAALNATAGALASPGQVADAERLGIEMTPGDVAKSIGEQAVAGAILGGAPTLVPHIASTVGHVASKVADTAAENAPAPVRDAVVAASVRAGTVKDRQLLTEWQKATRPYAAVGDISTPDERAAANVMTRDIETRETSPLPPQNAGDNERRLDAIAQSLGVTIHAPDMPSTAPVQVPTVRDRSGATMATRRPASFAEATIGAEGRPIRNPDSTADGYGQFTEGTWLSVAPKVTDTTGMSRDQILALRHDKTIAMRATDYYGAQNGRYLRMRGLEDSPGNLSLAHFLGPADATKVLQADPRTPVEDIINPKSFAANRKLLTGKSADELIAWAHKRIGGSVDHVPARPDAVPDEDFDYASPVPYGAASFAPDEVKTDAALMQYKSGGDEAGITDALRGVDAWNPLLSQQILVWERADGERIVADGHQRVGLAKRLFDDDPSIRLPAIVVREADGITAQQARVLGALRNIANGTGSLLDNARVLRDAPEGARMLPQNGPLTRDSIGLSRLSYPAFGAVANDVIDPRIAAQVGLHAGHSPDSHMAIIDLLKKERISNPAEAATVTRQALADGFGSADTTQLGMFGDMPAQSLYVPISRILSAAQKRLRDEKRTFKVLNEKASKIEAAGNRLDRAANESKVISNDEALAILDRTAHSAGPVRQALAEAARAELSGTRRADAVSQFLDALSGIDLRAAARGVESDVGLRGAPVGEGRGFSAEAADADVPGPGEPSLLDRAIAAKAAAENFSDPVGAGAKEQTDLLTHDLLQDAVATEASKSVPPIDPKMLEKINGGFAIAEPPEPPPHLFDLEQTGFRISDEGDNPKSIADIMSEAEADELAAKALRDCLK